MGRYKAGTQISHFMLGERLAAGGSGEVYKAKDTLLERPVALKFLTNCDDPTQKERFIREAKLWSTLIHPNIAVVYEAGWDQDIPFLAMELVDGEMLVHKIRAQELTSQQAIRYTKQILQALEEAHQRGIVHRDIKSSNIMITGRDQVKILDFGLAFDFLNDGDQKITPDGDVLGTVEFLSPEQARGGTVDARSDLFSTGVVLYQMLSGHLPFERDTHVKTFSAILHDNPEPLSSFMTNIPEPLDAILQKALSKDPDSRYQNSTEFFQELDAIEAPSNLRTRPIIAEPLRIAVLYFELIGDQENEYLRLGITEDIIIDLSKVAGLRVLSRYAIQKYKDKTIDVRLVARELQVHYVLHGSVQRANGRIRVTTQLIDGSTAATVWSDRYERQLQNLFELQDDVTLHITSALKIQLTDSEERSIQRRSTENLQAYEFYMRGRYYFNQLDPENNEKAAQMFSRAIAVDPGFAAAYSGLSEAYVQRFYHWYDRDRQWLKKAEEIIHKAYALNDQLPEVHCTLGMLLYLRGQYSEAMEEIQKAIRLDPHYALAHDHTGEIYLHVGELDKAIVAFHTEMRINADVIYPYFYLVWLHSLTGDFALAKEILEKAKFKHPRNNLLYVLEGTLASYGRDRQQAENLLHKAISLNPNNSFAMGRLSVVYAELGRVKEAVEMAEHATEVIDPFDHHAAFDRACVMSLIQDAEESLKWLRLAIDLGWRCSWQFQQESDLDFVRKHPEFDGILKHLNAKALSR
jgi:serine/threonine protein kinase/Flp pilus assembly protein TadD